VADLALIAQAIFAAVLTIVGGLQWFTLRRHARTFESQERVLKDQAQTLTTQVDAFGKQLETMKRQADDARAIQAARLTFEEFQGDVVPGDEFVVDVAVTIKNNGGTVAHDLSFQVSFGTYNLRYNPNPTPATGNRRPNPDLAGPSLAPGQAKRFIQSKVGEKRFPDTEVVIPNLGKIQLPFKTATKDVLGGNLRVYITLTVDYNDIFGQGHVTTDTMTYDTRTNSWVLAPNLRQHD
jgi:hypothetical protein